MCIIYYVLFYDGPIIIIVQSAFIVGTNLKVYRVSYKVWSRIYITYTYIPNVQNIYTYSARVKILVQNCYLKCELTSLYTIGANPLKCLRARGAKMFNINLRGGLSPYSQQGFSPMSYMGSDERL